MDLDSAMGGGKFCFSFLQNVNWNSALTACHAGHPGPEQSSAGAPGQGSSRDVLLSSTWAPQAWLRGTELMLRNPPMATQE